MKTLFLEDLANFTEDQIKEHLIEEYQARKSEVEMYDILIAYESVGSFGCDSTSFFLLKDKESGELFEVHGSHCSCYGFETQFEPSPTTIEYLKSNHFSFYTGGYDGNRSENENAVIDFLKAM
jgi:hypothetical protein